MKRPPISKRLQRAIYDAIYAGANETADELIRDLKNRPPDDWNEEETLLFDTVEAVRYSIEVEVRKILEKSS